MKPDGTGDGLDGNNIKYIYSINNISSVQIDLQMPMTGMPLPQAEEGDKQNILVKAEGNAIRITVQWDLIKESSSVVSSHDEGSGDPGPSLSGKYSGGSVDHPDEMVQFLTDEFQNKGVEYLFQIKIPKGSGVTNDFERSGVIEKVQFTKTGRAPVTWKGVLVFLAGDVVTIEA